MTDDADIDGLAGEYVLGTLDNSERASVAARRQREPALDVAIQDWERRLGSLVEAVPAAQPDAGLFAKIEARLSRSALDRSADVFEFAALQRKVGQWRTTALAASAIAAALALVLGAREFAVKPPSQNLVAVLQKDAASPAFLVSVDVENRLMTVRPVAAKHEPGKSFELWLVHDSLGAPKSLGLIDEPEAMEKPTLAAYKPDVIEQATYAVSLEPEGGSTTGAPTGPVVFAGKLIPTSKR
ncbi:MAG: anti-sigma factor domain-containing protein [Hyphomicrobium sp.]